MTYDPAFTISGEDGYIIIRRHNGWLKIAVEFWDKISERKRRTIINKWRRKQ